ncbi:MAG: BlaI/MecI/CopY family transcriptional regulator [Allosphingosinicella sp.]|uniref:BlaI/MecI/CopY family transcriptional regulator n=1 Tax=Allosphingosinicella sp. TaxID=2823234 RepID=UPI00393FFC13
MIDRIPPRERQVFETLLSLGDATVSDIEENMPDAPTSSAIRAMLARLERKGFVSRRLVEQKNLWSAVVPEAAARRSALSQLVRTFFQNSPASAATALLGMQEKIEPEYLDELEKLIRKAREEQA